MVFNKNILQKYSSEFEEQWKYVLTSISTDTKPPSVTQDNFFWEITTITWGKNITDSLGNKAAQKNNNDDDDDDGIIQ